MEPDDEANDDDGDDGDDDDELNAVPQVMVGPDGNIVINPGRSDAHSLLFLLHTLLSLSLSFIIIIIIISIFKPICPPDRHHLSCDDCLEDKSEDYQNCSVLYCVPQLFYTDTYEVLTGAQAAKDC